VESVWLKENEKNMNSEIFRTYDIRGIADEDLTDEVANNIGKAYSSYLPKTARKICMGRDIRLSSERLKNSFVEGVLSTGIDVVDLGVVPTPILYYNVHKHHFDGGVEITGSHNPRQYNGFKLLAGKQTIYGEDIQYIRKLAEKGEFRTGKGEQTRKMVINEYIQDIIQRVGLGKKKLKVVFDTGNGTAGPVIKKLFSQLPLTFEILFEKPDGNFPNHLPDPTVPQLLEELIKKVKSTKSDIGIGYDGDSDRIGAVDENGNIIWGDKLLAIFSDELLKKEPGSKIICEVKCSKGLIEYIESKGGIPIMWKTGHSLIKAKMREENALLAGEMSGHMFFGDNYFGFDDAIYASLKLLSILSKKEKTFSQLVEEIPSYPVTPEIRVECPDSEKFRVVEEVKETFVKDYKIIDVDGIRVIFPDGWGLLRASNTQPVLVLRFEANSQEALNQIKTKFMNELKKFDFVKI
jgi:phosphomannomutase/phosphoglucomutase